MKKSLIVGAHPLLKNLKEQYAERGFSVETTASLDCESGMPDINAFDELCVLTPPSGSETLSADNRALALLDSIVAKFDPAQHDGRKLTCHLLLQSETTLHLLHTNDMREEIRRVCDVYPFTMNEIWSRTIQPDRIPIGKQSGCRAHIVVFGMGQVAESVAINTALVAHFPNYVHNHDLRTRITIIDPAMEGLWEAFVQKYDTLFANSYYRVVNPGEPQAVRHFHEPRYAGSREDFVDVEWEFVTANSAQDTVRRKLSYWAADPQRVLTLVFANANTERSLAEATHLPTEVYTQDIPIYIYAREDSLFRTVDTSRLPLRPFGMQDRGYDTTLPHIRMAKIVNHIYDQFYLDNHNDMMLGDWQAQYAIEVDRTAMEQAWGRLSAVKRQSSICNALTVATKMRSLGLKDSEWADFYSISVQDMELMAEVEHNRWCVEELVLGWRPCTDDEQAEVEQDISLKEEFKRQRVHYDLRAYNDLRPDSTGRSVKIYDRCLCAALPLIANYFANDKEQ